MSTSSTIDLLGVLAYSELGSFERLAGEAIKAPSTEAKVALAHFATIEFHHYEQVAQRIAQLGSDAHTAMAPFVDVFDKFHDNIDPTTWHEGLIKAYVGDGIAADFYREISAYLDPETAALVSDVLTDKGQNEFFITHIREAIELDHTVGGRLALFGRRLMGEMISQASIVAQSRPSLIELFLTAPPEGSEAQDMSTLVNRLAVGHTRRMDELGLAS